MIFSIATTGLQDIRLPQWGRAFWQDPNDGELFLAYASGISEVDFITSVDSGFSWSEPELLFPVDDFPVHNNFDVIMDRRGHIHCGFRYNASGCYQFVGKQSGGGWTTASGLGPIGWITAGDSGVAGYQGSLCMQEAIEGLPLAINYPIARMVGKDSNENIATAAIGHPFNSFPTVDDIGSSPHAGISGGFPIISPDGYQGFSSEPNPYFVFFDEPNSTLVQWSKDYSSPGWYISETISIGAGEIGYAPNMAIGSGTTSSNIALVCTASGQAVYLNESFIAEIKNAESISNGTDLFWRRKSTIDPITGYVVDSGIVPTGLIYGVGPNTFSGSGITRHNFPGAGTNCDFSFNDSGETIFYFQMKSPSGKQSIGRFKSNYAVGDWEYFPMSDDDMGLKYTAGVTRTTSGGFANTLFWGGFKALKHPTEPQTSGNKLELIVTQSHVPTYPSGGALTVWNIEESPGLYKWQIPDYSINYTATSGTSYEVFSGITSYTNLQGLTGVAFPDPGHEFTAGNMFDGISNTSHSVYPGETLQVELVAPHTIDRIEVSVEAGQNWNYFPQINISGSFDGSHWEQVVTMSSGRFVNGTLDDRTFNSQNPLIKYQTMGQTETEEWNGIQGDNTPGRLVINNIDPFVAKHLIFQFDGINTYQRQKIWDIILYGPGASSPELITWRNPFESFSQFNLLEYRQLPGTITKTFEGLHGTVPAGWTTYGDFEWRIVGSGTDPDGPNGHVPSGLWSIIETQNGTRNGFSIRSEAIGDASGLGSPLGPVPAGGIQPGHSGVLEYVINIKPDEFAEGHDELIDGLPVPSRRIEYHLRSDVHIDDNVQFFTISPSEVGTTGTLRAQYGDWSWNNPPDIAERLVDPFSMVLTAPPSVSGPQNQHTLRWVYNKGAYDPSTEISYGAAWLDNVVGLDIVGIEKSRHGYLKAEILPITSSISGYLNAFGSTSIHGVIPNVDPLAGSINGYLLGSPQGTVLSNTINGYLRVNGLSIHGYVLGSPSGITSTTFPTSSIHGYIGVSDSGLNTSEIHGYLNGGNISSIWGYTSAFNDLSATISPGNLSIHGYLLAQYPTSQIYGVVGGPVETPSESIHGYVDAKFGMGDQVIHGYVGGPSGVAYSSIHGYSIGWNGAASGLGPNQKAIWGIVPGKTEATGNIYGYVLGNKPFSNILGYLGSEGLVASGGGAVGNPSTSNVADGINLIHGYIKGFDGFQKIHGYIGGEPSSNSTINGYVLGGPSPITIHGYSIGHAVASGAIHGYLDSIGFSSSSIHGYGFGISGIIGSQIHGYMVGVEIPTSDINGILIGTSALLASEDSSSYCPSHNFPLPAPLSITLPSGFIN